MVSSNLKQAGPNVILAVDTSAKSFIRTLTKLKEPNLTEAKKAIQSLLFLDVNFAPAALHLHQLTGRKVASMVDPETEITPYTFHLTKNDKYKASFTLEDNTAYLRFCGEHDWIDKKP